MGVEDYIDELGFRQVEGEFVVEGEVDDLPIVDAQCIQDVLVVVVGDLEEIGLLGGEQHEQSWIWGLLLEVWLLGGHRDDAVLVLGVIKSKHLDVEFVELGSLRGSDMKVDGGVSWVQIHELT